MLLHNLKLATRQLQKYKLQTLLSLVGLAIGFTCFALSSLWWRYETTYDAFHPDADNLYIQVTSTDKWATAHYTTNYGVSTLAMEKIPQVEKATSFNQTSIFANDIPICLCVVDSLFLPTMQPELIAGTYPQMQPDGTNAIVTDKLAMKLFGTTNCIGNELKLELVPYDPEHYTGNSWENGTYTIGAVIKDWGKHTIFPFDCIVPFKSGQIAEWHNREFMFMGHTVMRLHPMANADTVSAIINKIQPITAFETRVVRLSSYRTEFHSYLNQIKIEHIRTFALLGLIVVVCAVFNYLSLYTIRIRMRARELALRLVSGSSRGQLLILLVTEFILLLVAACILGVMFLELTLPAFREIAHIEEDTSFFFSEMGIYMLAVALGTLPLLVGVTWWVQRQSLNETLHKGMVTVHRNLFRPFSQWLQLAVCMGLVFFTSVIILQLHYLRNNTVAGFTYENRAAFYCFSNPELTAKAAHFLRSHPDVEEIKMGFREIGRVNIHYVEEDKNQNRIEFAGKRITREEADFWGLELLAGRWMEDHETDVAMLNESAVKLFNLHNPIDTTIHFHREHYRIVGVIRNVSYKSFVVPQEPVLYTTKAKNNIIDGNNKSDFIFSYRPGTWPIVQKALMDFLQNEGNSIPSFVNIEEEFNRLLHSEDTLLGLFYVMTGVCVLIALFGVYSLITISCEQRRKEIAVRKVYGATVGDILRLFFGEQLVVLLASALVGFPISYVCVKPWLEGYIHQVDIPLWLCPAIFLMVALLVALCIGWRVWKTANARPAEEIK